MAASLARVPVAESRLRRAVLGRLRRPPPGPLRGGSGRVRRRAVVLRGFVYFVLTRTRPMVQRDRSVAALGGDRMLPHYLRCLKQSGEGKGLRKGVRYTVKLKGVYSNSIEVSNEHNTHTVVLQ